MLVSTQSYKLSRYVCIHLEEGRFVVESPLGRDVLPLSNGTLFNLLNAFAQQAQPSEVLALCPPEQRPLVEALIGKFAACGWLVAVDEEGRTEEDEGALQHWSTHDLFFHARSRAGRHRNRIGAKAIPAGTVPPPVAKHLDAKTVVPLPKPDLDACAQSDPSLTSVLEARRSIRTYADEPLALDRLGEFLYRSCRITAQPSPSGFPMSRRVYPSGGSLYPLEVYVLAQHCAGVPRGLYHYDAQHHQLAQVEAAEALLDTLMVDARRAAGLVQDPPVLLCITARFDRTAWKYASIAYSLILKEVGALFQTLWLVAMAMKLAPCALGSGDSDVFAQAIDSRYYDETSVGEFVLGAPPRE